MDEPYRQRRGAAARSGERLDGLRHGGRIPPAVRRTGSGGYLNDTWEFLHGQWTNLSAGTLGAPRPRVGAGIAFDPTAHALVLFGGIADGPPLGDTWEFEGGAWYDISSTLTTSPSPRDHLVLGYDPASGTVVLFGGWSSGNGSHGRVALGDTWVFVSDTWSNQTVESGTAPSPREGRSR